MLTYHSHIFWCSNCLEKLYQGQCSLTVIKLSLKAHTFFVSKVFKKIKSQTIWFENIGQFLWKAHSVQDKIWIAPYCHLKDSTYIAIKNSFLLLEIFLKNFNQRHGLIHIVHLVNFGQSLSKSHIVWSMLNFAMFIAKPDQAKQCLKHIDQSLNLIALSRILYKFPLKALFCHLKYICKF